MHMYMYSVLCITCNLYSCTRACVRVCMHACVYVCVCVCVCVCVYVVAKKAYQHGKTAICVTWYNVHVHVHCTCKRVPTMNGQLCTWSCMRLMSPHVNVVGKHTCILL